MSEELKPCPFCGGEAYFSVGEKGDGSPWHYIECDDCSACGPNIAHELGETDAKIAIAEAWNKRCPEKS